MAIDPRWNALIAIWPTLGTGTTDQKLTAINSLNVTGVIPTSINIGGDQVINSIHWPEFNAIATASLQANLINLCNTPGQLLGGSANTTRMLVGMLLASFTGGSVTIANLVALSKAQASPWWATATTSGGGGLSSPVSRDDLIAAGNLT